MKCFLLKTDNTCKVVNMEFTLENYYKHLDCNCIDIAERKIGNKFYDVICDDEGLLVDNPKVCCIAGDSDYNIYGNIIICNGDDNGNEQPLTEDDIANIMQNMAMIRTKSDNFRMVVQLNH